MNIRSDIFVVYKRKSSTLHSDEEHISRFTLDVKGIDTTILKKNKEERLKRFDDKGWYYLGMFGQIGFSIALPIAGFAIAGKMIDTYWMTTPKWTVIGLGVGIIISIGTFIYSVKSILQERTK